MKKKVMPKFRSDAELIKFMDSHSITDYTNPEDWVRVNFKIKQQDQPISLRLSTTLIKMLKSAAKKHKTKYQKLIRHILEENIVKYLK